MLAPSWGDLLLITGVIAITLLGYLGYLLIRKPFGEKQNRPVCLVRDESGNEIELDMVEISRETHTEPGYRFTRTCYDYFLDGEKLEPDDENATEFTIGGIKYYLVIQPDRFDNGAEQVP